MAGLYGSTTVVVQQYFDKKRSLVGGLAIVGMGIGHAMWSPVTKVLEDTFGWRGTLMLISGLTLQGLPLSMLLRPVAIQNPNQDQQQEKIKMSLIQIIANAFDMSVLKNKLFWAYHFGLFFIQAAESVTYTFSYLRAVEDGVDPASASLLVTVTGIITIFTRIFYGWLGDRTFVNRMVLLGCGNIICGSASVLSYFAKGFPLLVVYSVAFGLFGR